MNNLNVQSLPTQASVQYISNEQGDVTGVIVPINVWQDLMSELETQHLLKSDRMRQRLLEARDRTEGLSLDEAVEDLGLNEV